MILLLSSLSYAKTITIKSEGNMMAFDVKEFTVKAGKKITVVMDNTSTIPVMKHNIVFLNDESKVTEVGTMAMSAPNYLPNHPAIIAATPLAGAGEKTKIKFKAPKVKGRYIYICTFPGHYNVMKGYMIVN